MKKRLSFLLIALISVASLCSATSSPFLIPSETDSFPSAKFRLYPNPAADLMKVQPPAFIQSFTYRICDMAGYPVEHKYVPMYWGNMIDVTLLAPAAYVIEFFDRKNGRRVGSQKFIKERKF